MSACGQCGREYKTVRGLTEHVAKKHAVPTECRRKIALVGFTASRGQAPYGDPDWEIWGLNNLHLQPDIDTSKFHRWFDLHPTHRIRQDKPHLEWLQAGADGLPVYAWEKQDDWPTSVEYPRRQIVEAFIPYFTNSVSWMLAAALLEVAPYAGDGAEVGVYGIDMAQGGADRPGEYQNQRPSCEFFLGIAAGKGIPFTIPEQSDLLKAASLYGAEGGGALAVKMDARAQELQQRQGQIEAERAKTAARLRELEDGLFQIRGALEDTQYYRGVWLQPETAGRSTHESKDTTQSGSG